MTINRLVFALCVLLAATCPATAEQSTTGPDDGPSPVCIAVLEPEVLGDLPADQRKALAGALDTLLTDSLGGQKNVVLVDRQLLDKVLAEHKALAAGAAADPAGQTKVTAADVAEPLRPFWAAGVLVCSQIDAKAGVVIIEAVAAQSGQLLAGVYAKPKGPTKADALPLAVQPKLAAFAKQIQSGLARSRGGKMVEVIGRLDSTLERGQPLVDEAVAAAQARVSVRPGLTLLLSRQPMNTREERLLRVMGLARPATGDAAAALCAAPDATVRLIVTERSKPGVAFDETPVDVTVELADQSKTFASTGGTFSAGLKPALAWLDEQLGTIGAASAGDDSARAAELARRLIEALADWKTVNPHSLRGQPDYVRSRIEALALRAAHLDPTNEEAGWWVAVMATTLDPNIRTVEQNRRIFRECAKYVDRFPKAAWDRRGYIMNAGASAGMWYLMGPRWTRERVTFEQFRAPPDPEKYSIARTTFRMFVPWAVEERRLHGASVGNSYEVSTRQMVVYLIPHIPADKLDEEYQWWSKFFREKVDTLSPAAKARNGCDIAAPWELIDAAFAVRRKDAPAVREKLLAAARKVPRSETWVWGGDEYNPYLVPIFLKAAGDPDWQKWNLGSPADTTVKVDINEMTAFLSRLSPRTPEVWDYAALPDFAGQDFAIPAAVRAASDKLGHTNARTAEALALAGGDLWLIAPGNLPGSLNTLHRFFVVPTDAKGNIAGEAREVDWPDKDRLAATPIFSCHYVTHAKDSVSMWIGTNAHGLARFEKIDGRWVGRWYNSTHGAPANGASRLTTCRRGEQEELLVIDTKTRRMYQDRGSDYGGPQLMVWTLDPQTGRSTLVHDGAKDTRPIMTPAAELADGRKVILEMAGSGAYDPIPQIAGIRRVFESGIWSLDETGPPFTAGPDNVRAGSRIWSLRDDTPCVQEISVTTCTPVRDKCPGAASSAGVSASISNQVEEVLGNIGAWSGSDRFVSFPTWPARQAIFSVGRGDVLWMAIQTDIYWDHCRAIVGYRPAPPQATGWAAADQWIGPFSSPNRQLIYGLRGDGERQMLLSTQSRVIRLDSDQLIEQAQAKGLVRSTAQWRQEFQDRVARSGWQAVLPLMIVTRQWAQADKLLSERSAEPAAGPDSDEGLRLLLWRARLLAEQEDRFAEAIRLYDQAANHPKAGGAGEAFARANQIILLHRAGRCQDMLDLAARVQTKFPQMQASGEQIGLGWYLRDARKRLAASGAPTTRPEGSSP